MIRLTLWRRGRGIIHWDFHYVMNSTLPWFTTKGWYRHARKNTYRLTIDHDYPDKPIWLGVRRNGHWYCTEKLYEPLLVTHHDFILSARKFRGAAHRSRVRRYKSYRAINHKNQVCADAAMAGNTSIYLELYQ